MNYYDGPPEPEWMGTMEFTCSAESERRMVTPQLAEILKTMTEPITLPWTYSTLEAEQTAVIAAWEHRAARMRHALSHIEEQIRTCGWEGEADAVIERGRLLWECPACGEEHDDPAPDPDLPEPEREDYEDR
jgi:rubrerythrin